MCETWDWLIHGDCLEEMKAIPDGSVDMVMVDPPYGTTRCKWDVIIPLAPMWRQVRRVTKKCGAIVMMANQPFTSVLIASNLKMFKYCWVWHKTRPTGFLNAKKQPLRETEDVCVFYRRQCVYNPQGLRDTDFIQTSHNRNFVDHVYGAYDKVTHQEKTGYPRTIVAFDRMRGGHHSTQKPVALMEYMIKTYTNEGETVLDFAMGSGTTGEACVNFDRNFIGIEIDPIHFKYAQERIVGTDV